MMMTKYRLCCISKNKTNPAYEGARIGAARVAKKLGCEIVNFTPNTPDDPQEQEALLIEALHSAPDAILISPAHPTALDPALQKVVDAKIPLIYFVCSSEAVKPQTFVTSDNYALAHRIAEVLIDALDGKGDVVIIEGSATSPTSAPRTQGFLDAMAPHPGITRLAQRRGEYQKENARQAMAGLLTEYPAIDGVLAANDFMAMGVIEALDAANRSVPVVGINATPAAYNAMAMACVATEAAFRILSGQQVPPIIELPVDIVDASNCDSWDRPYEERAIPEWEAAISTRV
jgi:ribose transport system substrate-binding protein